MNKYLPLIGIGAIVLIAAGAFLVLGKNKGTSTSVQDKVASSQASLRSLIESGSSQKCSYTDENSEGTFYLSNKKMRGDIKAMTEVETLSHMIVDGNTMYSWVEGQSTGFKFTYDIDESEKQEAADSFDLEKEVDYDCESWAADASVFVPPSNVTFSDMSSLIAPSGTSANPAANCSVCNSLEGDSKAQCLKALKC